MSKRLLPIIFSLVVLLGLAAPALAGESVVCSDAADQKAPAISGADVVWSDFRLGSYGLIAWDDSIASEAYVQVAGDPVDSSEISNGTIAFSQSVAGNYDVYMFDLNDGLVVPITSDPAIQVNPDIDGDKIVYAENSGSDYNIMMFDISNLTYHEICTAAGNQMNPKISGNKIVWEDYRDGNADVYVYDLDASLETAVCTLASAQENIRIDGDHLVWQDYRDGDYEIYFYDLGESSTQRITTLEDQQMKPDISGDRIVFEDWRNTGTGTNIYMYNLLSAETAIVSSADGDQTTPRIDGQRIVWNDGRNYGIGDIYMFSDLDAPTTTLTKSPVNPNGSNGWYQSKPNVTLTPNESADTFVKLDSETAAWSPYSALFQIDNGIHTVYYRSIDDFGNVEVTKSATIKVDTLPPAAPTLTTVIPNPTCFTDWTLEGTGPANEMVWYRHSSHYMTAAIDPSGNWTLNVTFDLGYVNMSGWTEDVAGNISIGGSGYNSTNIDISPPGTSINSTPATEDGTNGFFVTAPVVTINPNEAGTSYYKLDGGDTTTYSTALTLDDGTHTIEAWSQDIAGNIGGVASRTFKIDTAHPTTPTVTTEPPAFTMFPSQQIIGEASTSDYVLVYYRTPSVGFQPVTAAMDPDTGVWDVYVTFAEGENSWYAVTQDDAGNQSTATATKTVNVDNTAPVVTVTSDPSAPDGENNYYATPPSIFVAMNEAGDITYTTNAFDYVPYTGPITPPEGDSVYKFMGLDGAGNESYTGWYNYSVDSIHPTSPTLSAPDSLTTAVSTTLTAIGVSGDAIKFYQNSEIVREDIIGASGRCSYLASLVDGMNTFYAASFDEAGNASAASNIVSVERDNGKAIKAMIASPYDNQWYNGAIIVKGSASTTDASKFAKYTVEVQPVNPAKVTWTTIFTGLKPIANSTLATYNSGSTSGNVKVRLTVWSKTGDVMQDSVLIKVDNEKPKFSSAYSPLAGKYHAAPTGEAIRIGAVDWFSGIETVELKLNDKKVAANYDQVSKKVMYTPAYGLDDGYYTVDLKVYDKLGNYYTKLWTFWSDESVPVAEITSPAADAAVAGKVTVIGKATDTYPMKYIIQSRVSPMGNWANSVTVSTLNSINGGTLGAWSAPTVTTTTAYDLRLAVTDKANVTTYSDVRTVNVVPAANLAPLGSFGVISGIDYDIHHAGVLPVKGSATIAGFSKYILKARQTAPVSGSPFIVATNLFPVFGGSLAYWNTAGKNGTFDLILEIYNGGTTPASTVTETGLKLDNTKPIIGATVSPRMGVYTAAASPLISGTAGETPASSATKSGIDTDAFTLLIDGHAVSAVYNPATGVFTYSPASPLANAGHTAIARVSDRAGNLSVSKKWSFTVQTGNLTANLAKPVDGSAQAGSIDIAGVVKASDFMKYQIRTHLTPTGAWTTNFTGVKQIPSPGGNLFNWVTTGKNGSYEVALVVIDRAGNSVTDSVTIAVDNTLPVITAIAPATAAFDGTGAGLTVTATDPMMAGFNSGLDDGRVSLKIAADYLEHDGRVVECLYTATSSFGGSFNYTPEGDMASGGSFLDGVYTATATVYDAAGNLSATKSVRFTVDKTAPVGSITAPVGSSNIRPGLPVRITGQVADANIASWNLHGLADGEPIGNSVLLGTGTSAKTGTLGTWTPTDSIVVTTGYELRLTMFDKASQTTVVTIPVTVVPGSTDNPAGANGITYPVFGEAVRGGAELRGTATGSEFVTYNVKCVKDGVTQSLVADNPVPIVEGSMGSMPMEEGTYQLYLQVIHALVTEDLAPIDVEVDNTAPVVTSTSPTAAYVNTAAPDLTYNIAENGSGLDVSSVVVRVDGTVQHPSFSWGGGVMVLNLTGLGDGSHTVTLDAKDFAGNAMARKSWSFIVDTNSDGSLTSPTAAFGLINSNDGTIEVLKGVIPIVGTVFDQNLVSWIVEWSIDNLSWTRLYSSTLNMIDTTLYRWSAGAMNGTRYLRVTATDRAGNTQQQSTSLIVDNKVPTTAFTAPLPAAVVFGNCEIKGTAADTNLNNFSIDIGAGAAPTVWTRVHDSNTSAYAATLYNWDTTMWNTGAYVIKLTAADKATNSSFKKLSVRVTR